MRELNNSRKSLIFGGLFAMPIIIIMIVFEMDSFHSISTASIK